MSIDKLKEKLISKINAIDNKATLKQLLINIEFHENIDKIHIMSEGEIEAVNEGLAQLDRGEWISNEEANRRADEWLKK